MKMQKKEGRKHILYVRIKPTNAAWIKAHMKRLDYKSKSEFLDDHFDSIRAKKGAIFDRKSA